MKRLLLLTALYAVTSGAPSIVLALEDVTTFAGVTGATVIDSGVIVVESTPDFAREESFEYVRRPDGGVTLLNTINMTDGRFRVRARFDLDENWNSLTASGRGLYDGVPVDSRMERAEKVVEIQVHGEGVHLTPTAVCDPDCFINMSPTSLPMFVMTRHYDLEKGGPQLFRWTGQDLDRVRTLSGGTAELTYKGDKILARAALPGAEGQSVTIRHFTFVESLPLPDGGRFKLDFDLWTDDEHRPLGFRVKTPGMSGPGTIGFRQGWFDVRDQLVR